MPGSPLDPQPFASPGSKTHPVGEETLIQLRWVLSTCGKVTLQRVYGSQREEAERRRRSKRTEDAKSSSCDPEVTGLACPGDHIQPPTLLWAQEVGGNPKTDKTLTPVWAPQTRWVVMMVWEEAGWWAHQPSPSTDVGTRALGLAPQGPVRSTRGHRRLRPDPPSPRGSPVRLTRHGKR